MGKHKRKVEKKLEARIRDYEETVRGTKNNANAFTKPGSQKRF